MNGGELAKTAGIPAVASFLAFTSPDLIHIASVVGAGFASFVAQWWTISSGERANRLRLELEQLDIACERKRAELSSSDPA